MLRSLGAVGGSRLVALAVSFLCTVATVRLLTDAIGPAGFGAVSLIATLTALIPFADLGLGIAITNLTVDEGKDSGSGLRMGLSAVVWILAVVGVAVVAFSLVMSATDSWISALGETVLLLGDPNQYMPLFAVLFAVWLLTGPSFRILFGLGAAALVSLLQGLTSVVALVLLLILLGTQAPLYLLAFAPISASILVSIVAILTSRKRLGAGWDYLVLPFSLQSGSYGQMLRVGLAGMVFSVGAVLILQSDRLLLSLQGNAEELAIYSAAIPMYFAVQSMASALGGFLWPHYRKMLINGELALAMLRKHMLISSGAGVLAGGAIVAFSPLYFTIVGYADEDPWTLVLSIAALIVLQFATLPATSVLTAPRWIRAQGVVVVIAAMVKIAAAWFLIPVLGAAGGVVASIIAIGLIQLPSIAWMALTAAHRGTLDGSLVQSN